MFSFKFKIVSGFLALGIICQISMSQASVPQVNEDIAQDDSILDLMRSPKAVRSGSEGNYIFTIDELGTIKSYLKPYEALKAEIFNFMNLKQYAFGLASVLTKGLIDMYVPEKNQSKLTSGYTKEFTAVYDLIISGKGSLFNDCINVFQHFLNDQRYQFKESIIKKIRTPKSMGSVTKLDIFISNIASLGLPHFGEITDLSDNEIQQLAEDGVDAARAKVTVKQIEAILQCKADKKEGSEEWHKLQRKFVEWGDKEWREAQLWVYRAYTKGWFDVKEKATDNLIKMGNREWTYLQQEVVFSIKDIGERCKLAQKGWDYAFFYLSYDMLRLKNSALISTEQLKTISTHADQVEIFYIGVPRFELSEPFIILHRASLGNTKNQRVLCSNLKGMTPILSRVLASYYNRLNFEIAARKRQEKARVIL